MGAADEVEVVAEEEFGGDVGAEGEGDAAVVFAPALDFFVGVGPEEVTWKGGIFFSFSTLSFLRSI